MSVFPVFSRPVPQRGYQWWYIDASSSDGREHLVIIAFVGSVFSPYYARVCRRGEADPMDYCAINAALYRSAGKRWVLTEKPRGLISRGDDHFQLQDSSLRWNGNQLDIEIRERGVPIPQQVQGRITVNPRFTTDPDQAQIHLDPHERHQWWPFAPSCDVTVRFDHPDWRWRGSGYFDTNQGAEPLHEGFEVWNWSRSHQAEETLLTYNATPRSSEASYLALAIDPQGNIGRRDIAPAQRLKRGLYGMDGEVHLAQPVTSVKMLEDTPFYTRSMITAGDQQVMHESLSLERFRQRWVQFLLPFKTRRQR